MRCLFSGGVSTNFVADCSLIGHVFQLTYVAMVDKVIQHEKTESLPRLCYSTPKSKSTFLPHDVL